MSAVNWERESGERVEEFVAALLLLKNPRGNMITPSRGDRGVDIRIESDQGVDVLQVKRYSRPLTSRQEQEIKKSWATFKNEIMTTETVRSWTLVMPWDPTTERLAWMKDLTQDAGIVTSWWGRAQLDGLAAENEPLVNYYFGDGGAKLQTMLAQVLAGGQALPSGDAPTMLSAATSRLHHLAVSLAEIDPFYNYELQFRRGRLDDVSKAEADPAGAAMVTYEQLDSNTVSVLRIVPRSAESVRLRPIQQKVLLQADAGSKKHDALLDFMVHGAPVDGISGEVIEAVGPPGTTDTGTFLFSIWPLGNKVPNLELQLVDKSQKVIRRLPLAPATVSSGFKSKGLWVEADDVGGSLHVELRMSPEKPNEIRFKTLDITGAIPSVVLPGLHFAAAWGEGNGVRLGIRGGKPLSSVWPMGEDEISERARKFTNAIEALIEIQQHTYTNILVPAFPSEANVDEIIVVGRLLKGETVHQPWDGMVLTRKDDAAPYAGTWGEQFALRSSVPLSVDIGGQEIVLDAQVVTEYPPARVDDRSGKTPDDTLEKVVPIASRLAEMKVVFPTVG